MIWFKALSARNRRDTIADHVTFVGQDIMELKKLLPADKQNIVDILEGEATCLAMAECGLQYDEDQMDNDDDDQVRQEITLKVTYRTGEVVTYTVDVTPTEAELDAHLEYLSKRKREAADAKTRDLDFG